MPNVIEQKQLAVDMDTALAQLSGNVTIYCRVVKVFFNSWAEDKIELENAWRNGDRDHCVTLLHKLSGGAKSIAALQLSAALQTLKLQFADSDSPLPDIHLLDDLEALASGTEGAINERLDCSAQDFAE